MTDKEKKEKTEVEKKQETKKEASKKKSEELEKLKEELTQASEKYMRLAAEYDNYRKRTLKEKESTYSDAVFDTLSDLLSFADDFDRAMESVCTDEKYKAGMEMVAKNLAAYLEKHGVEEIDATGEFDPNFHNAVMHEQDETKPENSISQVLQKGYKIKGKVARASMVKVAN